MDKLGTELRSPAQKQLFAKEREFLQNVAVLVKSFDGSAADEARLVTALHDLDEPLMVVVVGEFNAGKSSFINALLGGEHLKTGVTPTTAEVFIVRHGASAGAGREQVHFDTTSDLASVRLPIDWLREVSIVDTPGTNAVVREHQRITEHFVPRADLVLFLTSAYHPMAESERKFLETIRAHGKRVTLVVNKVDKLDEAERAQVLSFVEEHATVALGARPTVIAVSARAALAAKQAGMPLGPSGFETLEQHLVDSLAGTGRLVIKLSSPLATAGTLLTKYESACAASLNSLKQDADRLRATDGLLATSRAGIVAGLTAQLDRVDSVLYRLAQRADAFFDATVVISKLPELVNGAALARRFEDEVVKDLSGALATEIDAFIDWFVGANHEQWRRVRTLLAEGEAMGIESGNAMAQGDATTSREASQQPDGAAGEGTAPAERVALLQRMQSVDSGRRRALLSQFTDESQRVVSLFDRKAEGDKLVREIKTALLATIGLEGAVGLGTAVVAALTDISGTLMFGVLATGGLFVLPYRRRTLKAELRSKVNGLQQQLAKALTDTFMAELAATERGIRGAIGPYAGFVVEEGKKAEALAAQLAGLRAARAELLASIEAQQVRQLP